MSWPTHLSDLNNWYKSHLKDDFLLSNEIPWLSFKTIAWLNETLDEDMTVFEYGSGGSTLFFARRVSRVVSVEHDQTWYDKMSDILQQRGITNVELCHYPPAEEVDDCPGRYQSAKAPYREHCFESYVKSIEEFDPSYDLVLVDGRARAGAFIEAFNRVKTGGRLILDDYRDRYEHALGKVPSDSHIQEFDGPRPSSYVRSKTVVVRKTSDNDLDR